MGRNVVAILAQEWLVSQLETARWAAMADLIQAIGRVRLMSRFSQKEQP